MLEDALRDAAFFDRRPEATEDDVAARAPLEADEGRQEAADQRAVVRGDAVRAYDGRSRRVLRKNVREVLRSKKTDALSRETSTRRRNAGRAR